MHCASTCAAAELQAIETILASIRSLIRRDGLSTVAAPTGGCIIDGALVPKHLIEKSIAVHKPFSKLDLSVQLEFWLAVRLPSIRTDPFADRLAFSGSSSISPPSAMIPEPKSTSVPSSVVLLVDACAGSATSPLAFVFSTLSVRVRIRPELSFFTERTSTVFDFRVVDLPFVFELGVTALRNAGSGGFRGGRLLSAGRLDMVQWREAGR